MFVFFALVLPLTFLATFLGLVFLRLRQLRLGNERQMRILARELGEVERLGPAAEEIMFGRREVTREASIE